MMTHEQRLDRLERIARLMVRAGLRARREMRQQDDKITIMIDAQIKNEDRFADLAKSQEEQDEKITMIIDAQLKNEERFAQNEERFAQNEERFAELAHHLDSLIDIVQKGRNGKSG